MARTTVALVQRRLGRDYDGKADLQDYVDMATSLVDELVTRKLNYKTIDDTRQELVERNLACHFYQTYDPGYSSKSTGGRSGNLSQSVSEKSLHGTRYGQTAIDLDTTGFLNMVANRARASFLWLGLPPSQQTDYDDRS